MQSENKWRDQNNDDLSNEYQTTKTPNGYYTDKGIEKESSPIKSLLIAGAIAGGGIAAYKSGLLKKGISEMIDYADNFKAVLPTKISTFKKWINEPSISGNTESLVRSNGVVDFVKKVFKSDNGIEDTIRATIDDIDDLIIMERKAVAKTKLQHNSSIPRTFINTDLNFDIARIRKLTEQFDSGIAKKESYNIMSKDLLETSMLSKEKAATQLKRTGYRTATLGDILDMSENAQGRFLSNKESFISLDNKTLSNINSFLRDNGLFSNNPKFDWKNIILDKNILVNENGRVSDLRHVSDNVNGFIRSISSDFKIPFVGLNPFGMLELDKVGIRDIKFATMDRNLAQPIITGEQGFKTLESLGNKFGSENLLFSNGNVYAYFKDSGFKKIRNDIEVLKLPTERGKQINRKARDVQKIANINTKEFIEYGKDDTTAQRVRGKISKYLDIGKQDPHIPYPDDGLFMGTLGKLDPSNLIEKISGKLFSETKFWNKGYTTSPRFTAFGGNNYDDNKYNMYLAIKRKIKFREFINPNNNITIKNYFAQFLAGRNNLKDVNESSLKIYHLFERMNESVKPFGIAFSNESIGSTQDFIKNMLLKRFLPIYAGYKGFQYINYLTEDENGENNIEQRTAKSVATINTGVHTIWGKLGGDKAFKRLKDLTPGSDNISELPGINMLNLDKDGEEMSEYYKTGMVPVRKGRYWPIGNTAFTGGKIEYYKPIAYRRIMADADFSEVKFGSREEYFQNAWFPTPTHPFAPIRHFITDRYHYEDKHYYDRPYLLSSPEFENVPLFGPALSGTVGRLVKPQLKMHPEYWNYSPQQQLFTEVNNPRTSDTGTIYLVDTGTQIDQNISLQSKGESGKVFKYEDNSPIVQSGQINYVNPRINKNQRISIGVLGGDYDEPITTKKGLSLGAIQKDYSNNVVYTTKSGQQSIVDIGDNDVPYVRHDLKNRSIKSIKDVNVRASTLNTPQEEIGTQQIGTIPYNSLNPNSFKNTFVNQYQNLSEVTGIYGYLGKTYAFGDLGKNRPEIETSGQAYSFNDKFWEQEYGGLGGELSEIFRRLVQKQPRNTNRINPVENTQPQWMPGDNYFVDYKHGDPYQKLTNGELRLQGTPYEKLWNISDPLDFGIGSSSIGKSKSDIIRHYLHLDTPDDDEIVDILTSGTKEHEKTEEAWLKSGFAIDVEQKIEDKENNIIGYYDARVHDNTSKTGEAIVDIKTISSKGFEQIKKTGKGKDVNVKQLNFYLWKTGNDKGYLHYINRDTGEKYTVTVNYDEQLLQDTLDNLNDARQEVMNMLINGDISRGDLYKPIDRFRILADVAPYSEEFRNMETILKRSGMDEETKKEYDEITSRMQKNKAPHRTYEYKFKTANLKSIKTKITKVEGSDIYVDFEGRERKVNLAGISAGDIKRTAEVERGIEEVKKNLKPGTKVTLAVDNNKSTWNDTKGIKAILYDNKNTNINKKLVQKGYYKYDEDDNSPTAVNVRYGKFDRLFGTTWEKIAHADTYINTKFLHVRSALEDYERTEVYGKNFQQWQNPIKDYLMPSIYHNIGRAGGPILGTLTGAFVGSLFGRNKYATAVGAVIGGSTVLFGKMYAQMYELTTGKTWIPSVRRKERELEEYTDVLKYVKNMKLFNYYKQLSLKEEGFNVDAYLQKQKENAEIRNKTINKKNKIKEVRKEAYKEAKEKRDEYEEEGKPQKIYYNGTQSKIKRKIIDIVNDVREGHYEKKLNEMKSYTRSRKQKITDINKEINQIENYRNIQELPPLAMKAIEYKQLAEKTMYGYDTGEPLTNLLSALPKKDRDRMKYFMKAPEEERKRILEIVPDYVKRPLQAAYGMEVDKKPTLQKYFKNHMLPDENWAGWREDVDLNDIKVKMIQRNGLDESEFNIWEDDLDKADQAPRIPIPKMNYRTNASDIRNRLHKLLGDMDVENLNITYSQNNTGKLDVNLDLEYDKKEYVNEMADNLDFIKN